MMIVKRVRNRTFRVVFGTLRELKLKFTKTLNVSIGENCLTDNILERHGLKSLTTVYSHGRSNLDYAIALELDRYKNLLERNNLYHAYFGESQVVRNNYYKIESDIYNEAQSNGFEFTHHDVISNIEAKKSILRKMNRLIQLAGKKSFRFFYHYRISDKFAMSEIFKKAQVFLSFYANSNINKNEFIVFSQEIVNDPEKRGLDRIDATQNICCYLFRTTKIWEGDDDNFWARGDDDLIKHMLSDVLNKRPNPLGISTDCSVTRIL